MRNYGENDVVLDVILSVSRCHHGDQGVGTTKKTMKAKLVFEDGETVDSLSPDYSRFHEQTYPSHCEGPGLIEIFLID